MFTTCTGACPVMSGTMAKIQDHLGDRVGKDVRLISISVDPVNDTPAKLKEYAARFHARPGWYFLTGSKENVEAALRKLGQWVGRARQPPDPVPDRQRPHGPVEEGLRPRQARRGPADRGQRRRR